jgi:hypothetical protein
MVAKDGFDQSPYSEAPSIIPGVIFTAYFAVAVCVAGVMVKAVTRRIRKPDKPPVVGGHGGQEGLDVGMTGQLIM